MQYQATVPDGDYYTIQPEIYPLDLLEIYNAGPQTVYYGRRIADITAAGSTTNLSPLITLTSFTEKPQQGMICNGTGIPTDSQVLSVVGDKVTLNGNATATGTPSDLVFTAVLDETTGQPIPVGATKSFTPTMYRQFLQQGFDLYVPASEPSVVQILKIRN